MTTTLTNQLRQVTDQLGAVQVAGPLAVVPVLGPDHGVYPGPRTGLQLGDVRTYGSLELKARADAEGPVIAPLHIGWIQKGAQNHALCRSVLLGPGEDVLVEDACCVQASQGGYLSESDQWFFVLPLGLRDAALSLRGEKNYGKLWNAITEVNQRFGEHRHGHLEVIIGKRRRVLNRFRSQLEIVDGQTGALVFLRGRLVGVELTPSTAYFAEVWPALACFTYGVEAHGLELAGWAAEDRTELVTDDLDGLRTALTAERAATRDTLLVRAAELDSDALEITTEDRVTGHALHTVTSEAFAGQVVHRDDGALVYASLFARSPVLKEILAVA